MKTIIFDYVSTGHHIEYLHHLYIGASQQKCKEYIFLLPKTFEENRNKLEWPKAENIRFVYHNHDVVTPNPLILLKNTIHMIKTINHVCKKYNANRVFFISLIEFFIAIPLLLSSNIKASGIIYDIYLYKWKNSSFKSKILYCLKFLCLSKSQKIEKVMVLNDVNSANIFNRKYKTNKFVYLPDPYVPIIDTNEYYSEILQIKFNNKIVIAHIGAMDSRKGTLLILKSIVKAGILYKNLYFIFAGKVMPDIREEFYRLLSQIEDKSNIIVKDYFCSYNEIAQICKVSNYILAPYSIVNRSSGMLGYASQFSVPLIVPDSGLIGKLVKRYQLGVTIKDTSIDGIIECLSKIKKTQSYKVSSRYCKDNNIDVFNSLILKEYLV